MNQPSIILYFSSEYTLAIGYDNISHPRHVIEIPKLNKGILQLRNMNDAQDIYHLYSVPIERLIHLLGGGNYNNKYNTTTTTATTTTSITTSKKHQQQQRHNRYVVLHPYGIYMNRYWKIGMIRILYDICHATMISFLSTIYMIPFSIVVPSISTNHNTHNHDDNVHEVDGVVIESTTTTTIVLSIHITINDVQCMIYANGHHLEYTYQSFTYNDYNTNNNTNSNDKNDSLRNNIIMIDDIRKLQEQLLLLHNNDTDTTTLSSPLIYAIVLCLDKCPIHIRKDAIQNIYFSGTILVSNFQYQVAVLLYNFLIMKDIPVLQQQSQSQIQHNNDEVIVQDNDDIKGITTTSSSSNNNIIQSTMIEYIQIPINRTALRSLATYIGLIDLSTSCSSDSDNEEITNNNNNNNNNTELIPWYGASIYIQYWRHVEQESGQYAYDAMNWIEL